MNSLRKYNSPFKEEENSSENDKDEGGNKDVSKAIKAFIDTKWSKDEDMGKVLSLLKGILFSDSPEAKKFVKDLDDASDKLNAEDY